MPQLRIADPAIGHTYQRIIASDPHVDFMLLSYVGQTDDLRIQEQGTGGLEELQESWNDGRMQYGFVRVKDVGSGLTKFVLITWCGDGVVESRKGLFHSHANTVAQFLKGYHVQINARSEADVEPAHVLKKIVDSSGAKYSIHQEKPIKRELPAPVGTNYKPIGRPDIASITSKHKAVAPEPVGTSYTPLKNELAQIRAARTAPSVAPVLARAPVSRVGIQDDFKPTVKATSTPPPPPIPSARPAVFQPSPPPTSADAEPEGRPGYVGTAYTPVSLGKPGKLGNRLSAFAVPQETTTPSLGGAQKSTWAQRQALGQKQREEEDARSRAAIERSAQTGYRMPLAATSPSLPAPPSSRVVASDDDFEAPTPKEAQPVSPAPQVTFSTRLPSPPPPPPPPPAPEVVVLSQTSHPSPPPAPLPPPPPPAPETVVISKTSHPSPPPAPSTQLPDQTTGAALEAQNTHQPADEPLHQLQQAEANLHQKMDALALASEEADTAVGRKQLRAVVAYSYQKAEENEMNLLEGEVVEQIEELDEGWWSGVIFGDGETKQGLFPANYVEVIEDHGPPKAPEPVPEPEVVPQPDKGAFAVALYEYTAAEDNELSFREGQEIYQIEFSSDGWWTGSCSPHERGLFPANYVELQGDGS